MEELVIFHKYFPSWYFYKKMIENCAQLRYNYFVDLDFNPTEACPAGEMRFHYGKKSRHYFQRHSLPHHP